VVGSRTGPDNYETLPDRHKDAQVLINTTPVGMWPKLEGSPVDLRLLPKLTDVADVIYNPGRTNLLLQAEELGLRRAGGLPMLVQQAKRAEELFFDRAIPDAETEKIAAQLRREMTNIVLVGMPGSGKTTVGQELARLSGKPFVDLDEEIVKRAGKPIPDIFAQEGEDAFRALETQIVREAGARTGCVLSAGGGVVTREENYAPLHQNGVIVHLRRDVSLLPTAGRPASQSTDLRELWRRRAPLYAAFADLTADNAGTIEDAADQIIKELEKL